MAEVQVLSFNCVVVAVVINLSVISGPEVAPFFHFAVHESSKSELYMLGIVKEHCMVTQYPATASIVSGKLTPNSALTTPETQNENKITNCKMYV